MLETLGTVFLLLISVGLIVGIFLLYEFLRDIYYRIEDLEYRNKNEDDRKFHEAFYKFTSDKLNKDN